VSILLHLKISVNRACTEHQQSVNRTSTYPQQSVNRVSTTFGVASCTIHGLCNLLSPESTYWQPLSVKDITTWSQPQSANEHQHSINNFSCCTLYNQRAVLRHLYILEVLAAFRSNIVCVNTATTQNEHHQSINRYSTERQQSINTASTQCQQSVNDFSCCILNNPRDVLQNFPIINVLAAIMSKTERDTVTAPVCKSASTERQ
jgi:hypothetical protein